MALSHPKDRKVQKQQGQAKRAVTKLRHKAEAHVSKQRPLVDKLTWFQLYLADRATPPSLADLQAVIREYINRSDQAMAALDPSSKRHHELRFLKEREEGEWNGSGFELPATLLTRDGFRALRDEWRGDYQHARTLFAKMTRYPAPNK